MFDKYILLWPTPIVNELARASPGLVGERNHLRVVNAPVCSLSVVASASSVPRRASPFAPRTPAV